MERNGKCKLGLQILLIMTELYRDACSNQNGLVLILNSRQQFFLDSHKIDKTIPFPNSLYKRTAMLRDKLGLQQPHVNT